jgi:hypothetical protein
MRNYFKLADKKKDQKLTKLEIEKFLGKLNLKIDKNELKYRLKVDIFI